MPAVRQLHAVIAAETYWSIVTNPGHIGAELTWSIILDVLLIQPVRWLVGRHDRKAHAVPTIVRRHDRKVHESVAHEHR